MVEKTDILIIGAGHMGLVLGHYLKLLKVDFKILEAESAIGAQWRKRYNGLSLFTPNSLNRLPDFYQPTSKNTYLTKDEFAKYLASFAKHKGLTISLNCKVISLTYDELQGFCIQTTKGEMKANKVVLATGAFSKPLRLYTGLTCFQHLDLNELAFMDFKNKHIVVAGDGASGRQISKVLSKNNTVYLAQGKPRTLFSPTILGVPTFTLLKLCGLLRIPKRFKLAQLLKRRDPFPDTDINNNSLTQFGVQLVPRVLSVESRKIILKGGGSICPDVLISAIGYQQQLDFIDIPEIKINDNELNTVLSEASGLFCIGQAWQHNRASGLIYGAEYEAKKVIEKLHIGV